MVDYMFFCEYMWRLISIDSIIFYRQYPDQCAQTYHLPPFFSCDWMDEVWRWREDVDDDFKFVYMGPAGTW